MISVFPFQIIIVLKLDQFHLCRLISLRFLPKINTSNQEIVNKFDKEINSTSIKLRIKEEGIWPALAIGLNNFDGPSFNASEYLVANYGQGNIDFSLALVGVL